MTATHSNSNKANRIFVLKSQMVIGTGGQGYKTFLMEMIGKCKLSPKDKKCSKMPKV